MKINEKVLQRMCFILILGVLVSCIVPWNYYLPAVNAKTKKVHGVDRNGIEWKYNKKTKTLTFYGTGAMEDFIMDGHSDEPSWYLWEQEVEHLVIKKGITRVGQEAFSSFTHVKSVHLADTVTSIGKSAFDSCIRLQKLHMSRNITKIEANAFCECETLKQVEIPKNTTYIGYAAFEYCESLTELTIPIKVKYIGRDAFAFCSNLKTIKLPSKLKTIHQDLFYNCESLKNIVIPQSVTTIYAGAFAESGIETLVIPKNVKEFKQGDDGEGVFNDCLNLTKIEIRSKKIEECFKHTFDGILEDVVIEVPKSKYKEYKTMFRNRGLNKKVKIKGV